MKAGSRDGNHFQSTSRVAYLPDTEEGREVCHLL
jgi:hypothetical protein